MSQLLSGFEALAKDLGSDHSNHNGRLTIAYYSGSRGFDSIWKKRKRKKKGKKRILQIEGMLRTKV